MWSAIGFPYYYYIWYWLYLNKANHSRAMRISEAQGGLCTVALRNISIAGVMYFQQWNTFWKSTACAWIVFKEVGKMGGGESGWTVREWMGVNLMFGAKR